MWRLVSEGLRIHRTVLSGALLGTLVGTATVFALLTLFGVSGPRTAVQWYLTALPVAVLFASAVAGWIALGSDLGEQRLRLHLLLPIRLVEVGLAQHLLPCLFLGTGAVLAHVARAVTAPALPPGVSGLGHAPLAFIAAVILLLQQLTLAVRQVVALRERGRLAVLLGILPLAGVVAAAVAGPVPGPLWARTVQAALLAVCAATFSLGLFCRRRQLV